MSDKESVASCNQSSWLMAALVGVLVMVIARFLADMSWMGAVVLGLIIFVVAGFLFTYLFCRDAAASGSSTGAVTPAAQPQAAPAAAPKAKAPPAAAPTPKPAAAPKPKPAPKPAAEPKPEPISEPAPAPVAGGDGKPAMLSAARDGGADNLKQIKGVGPKLESLLNGMGVYHFDQVAGWSDAEVAWVDQNLEGFKGRVSRDEWVKQAKLLAEGGTTEFSKRVKKGDVY